MPTGKNRQFELEEYIKQGKSDDLPMIYLGEIYNMPGHGIFVGRSGKCYFGYHIDNFRELKEDEVWLYWSDYGFFANN